MRLPTIKDFSFSLSSSLEFVKDGWNKRLKQVGGRGGRIRKRLNSRYVYLPNTPEGLTLATELIERFSREPDSPVTMVCLGVDGLDSPDWRPFPHGRPGPCYPKRDRPIGPQLETIFRQWEERAREWWTMEGISTAKAAARTAEAANHERLDKQLTIIAAASRRAMEAGANWVMIHAAVETALRQTGEP